MINLNHSARLTQHYTHYSSVILRAPLFPISFLRKFLFSNDLHHDLKAIFRDPVVRESIYLVSPVLFHSMDQWINGKELSEKQLTRLIYTLSKYLLRMSTRSTPFGMFAGNSIGAIANSTHIELDGLDKIKRNVRIDLKYLYLISQTFIRKSAHAFTLRYLPNPTVFRFGNNYRLLYCDFTLSGNPYRSITVPITSLFELILETVQTGKSINQLVETLLSYGTSADLASQIVDQAIIKQLIVPEMYPNLTGDGFLERMIQYLAKEEDTTSNVQLQKIKQSLDEVKESTIGIDIQEYEKVIHSVEQIGIPVKDECIFYTSMFRPAKRFELDEKIVDELKIAMVVMNKLSPYKEIEDLARFKNKFRERYQGQEVSLLKVLDIESGIGFKTEPFTEDPAPFLEDLPFDHVTEGKSINWTARESYLFKKYSEALQKHAYEVEILPEELSMFNEVWTDLPSTIPIIFNLFRDPKTNETKLSLLRPSGNASNVLGRFSDDDKQLLSIVEELVKKEPGNSENILVAEIVHIPDLHLGNIAQHPILREYEIPVCSASGVQGDKVIALDDLFVSLRDNQVVLRSKHHNKYIVPRLTNAHSFHRNTSSLYYFLCVLQLQKTRSGLSFSWGALADEYSFLPRVHTGNIILLRAQWNFAKSDIKFLQELLNKSELMDAIHDWQKKFNLPEEVILMEGDNELYVNFTSLLSVKIFLNEIRTKEKFSLIEYLFNETNSDVTGPGGCFANQFVLPFYRTESISVSQ